MNKFSLLLLAVILISCVMVPNDYKKINNLSKIYRKYDDFNKTTYYQHEMSFSTAHTVSTIYHTNSPMFLYVAQGDDGRKTIFARFYYYGSDWIFFNKVIIKDNNGNQLAFNVESYDKNTEVLSGGNVKESIDIPIPNLGNDVIDNKFEKLSEIINNGGIKIRLTGKYYKDYVISPDVIQNYQEMLNLYESL